MSLPEAGIEPADAGLLRLHHLAELLYALRGSLATPAPALAVPYRAPTLYTAIGAGPRLRSPPSTLASAQKNRPAVIEILRTRRSVDFEF